MVMCVLFECHLAECGGIDRTELFVQILVVAHDAYHGSIVGGIAELGDIYRPAIALGVIVEGVAQSVVGTDATSYCHMLDASLLHSELQFLHQDVNNRPFQRGRNILFVMLDEIRIFFDPLAQIVEE